MYLYDSQGLLIATSTASVETANFNGWVTVTFPTPILFLPQYTFTLAYGDPTGYSESSGVPGVVDPEQMAWVTGRYGAGSGPGFPPNASGTIYFCDPVWHVDDPGAWPTAVSAPAEVVEHEAKSDPHPQYGTSSESDPNLTTDFGNTLGAGHAYVTAVGAQPSGVFSAATVVGCRAGTATVVGGIAVGYAARVDGAYGVAIGHSTQAQGAGSVALGVSSAGVAAVAPNTDQIMLGTPTHSVAVPGTLAVKGQPINPWVPLTQAAYDALATKDPSTLYVIVPG